MTYQNICYNTITNKASNNSINTFAPAKINLYLHVHKRLPSGYHYLESFIVFLNLYDKIEITSSSITNLELNGFSCGSIKDNLVLKVVKHLKDKFNLSHNVNIKLNKLIPVGAGLGGGSADAAAVLKALNNLWNLNLSLKELANIAIKFGADIPSCIYSTSGLIEEMGNKFTPLPLNFKLHILLVSNLISLTTKNVYNNLKPEDYYENSKLNTSYTKSYSKFIDFIVKQKNSLTISAVELHKEIQHILTSLNNTSPILSRMTGSGSCCFAIYSSAQSLNQAYGKIKKMYPDYFVQKVNNL